MSEKDGFLNIRDPSCYVFEEENNCKPGDHFTSEKRKEAAAFVSYKPFPFRMPLLQKMANWISVFALFCVLLILILYTWHKIANCMRAET